MFLVVEKGRQVKVKFNTAKLFTIDGFYLYLMQSWRQDPRSINWTYADDPALSQFGNFLRSWMDNNATGRRSRRSPIGIWWMEPNTETKVELNSSQIITYFIESNIHRENLGRV